MFCIHELSSATKMEDCGGIGRMSKVNPNMVKGSRTPTKEASKARRKEALEAIFVAKVES